MTIRDYFAEFLKNCKLLCNDGLFISKENLVHDSFLPLFGLILIL